MLLVAKDIEKKLKLCDQKQIRYILKMDCISYHNNTFKQKTAFLVTEMYIRNATNTIQSSLIKKI